MRLCLIYNVWHDYDLLAHSIRVMRNLVDGIIVIASTKSNFGEYSPISEEFKNDELFVHEPRFNIPMLSETDKRNYGLSVAREKGYTHFLTIDADEMYESEPFLKQKERFKNEPKLKGLVCLCQTYFKSPKLTIGLDTTLVPFIHELQPGLRHEFNRNYQFAWIDGKIRIDPSRSMNITSGVERCDLVMHHASFIRKDINIKIRNSSARSNLERSSIIEDYKNAKPGYFCKFYGKTLMECDNIFGLPSYED